LSDAIPSAREQEILKILWDKGPATVREVRQQMCPDGELAFNTVQTLLRIMDEKGLVRHYARGRTFVYAARRSRDAEAARLLNRLFDGAVEQCVVSLLNTTETTAEELKRLEKIIADARRRKQAGRNK
jgi:BlaI family transcriptional regulator, penicillinase repressor